MSNSYVTVATTQTGFVLSGNNAGARYDHIQRVIVVVGTSATGTCALLDGATSISLTEANIPIGTYVVELDIYSKEGAWSITTGAGCTAIAIGTFT